MTSRRGEGLDPRSPRGRKVVWATGIGATLAFLDGTLVQVALPSIGRDLSASFASLQWVVDGYLLSLGSLILIGGALGDRFGRRRIFGLGVLGFALGSLACGLSPSSEALVTARILQGLFAALLVPGSLSILSSAFEGEARGEAIGTWSALSAVATAGGPIVGGWIIQAASWRWAFLINLPVAALCLVALRSVPESSAVERGRPDGVGALLGALGLGGVCFWLIEGPTRGITTPEVLTVGLGGILSLGGFLVWERRASHPMIPPSLLRNPAFLQANLVTWVVYLALSGTVFVEMLLLQSGFGYSAFDAGLALLPMTAMLGLLARPAGRFAGRVGARRLLVAGPVIASAGIFHLSLGDDRFWTSVLPGMSLLGLGMAGVVAPLTTWVFATVPEGRSGIASGVNNAVARLAGLAAVAVLPLLAGMQTASLSGSSEAVTSAQVALRWAGFSMLAGAALAWRRPAANPEGAAG